MDIDNLPILKSTSSIYNSLMYKNNKIKSTVQYWLLFDNGHYHTINNIKGFIAVKYFCPKCLNGFQHQTTFDEHKCDEFEPLSKDKPKVKSSRILKYINHYMNYKTIKGGKAELDKYIESLEESYCKEEPLIKNKIYRKYNIY